MDLWYDQDGACYSLRLTIEKDLFLVYTAFCHAVRFVLLMLLILIKSYSSLSRSFINEFSRVNKVLNKSL